MSILLVKNEKTGQELAAISNEELEISQKAAALYAELSQNKQNADLQTLSGLTTPPEALVADLGKLLHDETCFLSKEQLNNLSKLLWSLRTYSPKMKSILEDNGLSLDAIESFEDEIYDLSAANDSDEEIEQEETE